MLLWGSLKEHLFSGGPDEIPHGADQGVAYSDFLKGQVSNMQLPGCQRAQGVVGAAVSMGHSAMRDLLIVSARSSF